MQFQGAVIREQNVTFAIIVVKPSVLNDSYKAQETVIGFGRYFPGVPVVLMAQDLRGVPTYYGRKDIVQFMSRVPLHAIEWKSYTAD